MLTTRTRVLALPAAGLLLFGAGQPTGRSAAAGNDGAAREAGSATCSTETLKGSYGLNGTGAGYGSTFELLGTASFDGKGGMDSKFIAVIHQIAQVINVDASGGEYKLNSDCTGTVRVFTKHDPPAPPDHFHNLQLVVTDGGKRLVMTLITTEYAPGKDGPTSPSAPTEAGTFVGHRM